MKNRWLSAPLILGLSVPLLLGACGGDDDDSDGLVDTPVPLTTDRRLLDAQAAFAQAEFTGTYSLETVTEGGTIAGEAIYVAIPPDRVAVDFTGEFGGIAGRLITIRTPEVSYICQEQQAEDAPPPFCLEGGGSVVGVGDLAQLNLATVVSGLGSGSDVTVEEAEGREIAGKDGECFTYSSEGTEGLLCFEEESGIMLLVEATYPGGSTRIEATDIDDDTDEEAFEPPFDILGTG